MERDGELNHTVPWQIPLQSKTCFATIPGPVVVLQSYTSCIWQGAERQATQAA